MDEVTPSNYEPNYKAIKQKIEKFFPPNKYEIAHAT
jgi:hypothetical protein